MYEPQTVITSADEWRTDRVNVMVYGPPGSGKTDFAARFPTPLLIDTGENGALTLRKMRKEGRLAKNIPIVRTTSFKHAYNIVNAPKERCAEMFPETHPEFPNFQPETIIVDNVSVLEEWCMEEVCADKGKTEADGPEINRHKSRMKTFFRAAWNLSMNTVLIASEYDGRDASAMYKAKPKGPQLLGDLAKSCPAATDFYLYFTTEYEYDVGDIFVAYTGANQTEYPARTRLKGFIPDKLTNPSYDDLRYALDKLEAGLKEGEEL